MINTAYHFRLGIRGHIESLKTALRRKTCALLNFIRPYANFLPVLLPVFVY